MTQVAKPDARYATILADPPWRFLNRTGKMAPEHRRLLRYQTMTTGEIQALPVRDWARDASHLYLWVPNALLAEGLGVMQAWGFQYKTNLIWYKIRKDGGPDGRGVGFYFRNVTEMVLFGIRGRVRTLAPGRRQVNLIPVGKKRPLATTSHVPDAVIRTMFPEPGTGPEFGTVLICSAYRRP